LRAGVREIVRPIAQGHWYATAAAIAVVPLFVDGCDLGHGQTGLCGTTARDQRQLRITELEQEAVELRRQLEEFPDDLDAARSVNREYLARLDGPAGSSK
jgi:hypothetical protein